MMRLEIEGRFFEGPRWHDGRWWVSDMTNRTVSSLDAAGNLVSELKFEDRPSGLGWLSDGTMIVVAMDGRKLMSVSPVGTEPAIYVDLDALCGDVAGYLNDMVVTPDGHIYVGFDPDLEKYGFQSEAGAIFHVDPNRNLAVAATGLHFPNGLVVSGDGKTLIVAETGSPRLTAFTRSDRGALHDRRLWAAIGEGADRRSDRTRPLELSAVGLDGCALATDGSIWVANSSSTSCLRVAPDGAILDAAFIPAPYRCLACALGGEDGRTLLLCGLKLSEDHDLQASVSHLFSYDLADPVRQPAG